MVQGRFSSEPDEDAVGHWQPVRTRRRPPSSLFRTSHSLSSRHYEISRKYATFDLCQPLLLAPHSLLRLVHSCTRQSDSRPLRESRKHILQSAAHRRVLVRQAHHSRDNVYLHAIPNPVRDVSVRDDSRDYSCTSRSGNCDHVPRRHWHTICKDATLASARPQQSIKTVDTVRSQWQATRRSFATIAGTR